MYFELLSTKSPSRVPVLVQALEDKDWGVRQVALTAVYHNCPEGPRAREMVPGLITALRDSNESVRKDAARVLRHLGPAAEEAVPALIDEFIAHGHPDSETNRDVIVSLGRIGPPAREAIPALIKTRRLARPGPGLYEEQSSYPANDRWAPFKCSLLLQYAVIECTLTKIDPQQFPPEDLVATLIKWLEHPEPRIRNNAVRVLAEMGPEAKQAVPALRATLKDHAFANQKTTLDEGEPGHDPYRRGGTNGEFVRWAIEKIDPQATENGKSKGGLCQEAWKRRPTHMR